MKWSDSCDVITGGAGFIGSHLVDALITAERPIHVIDNFVVGRLENLARHRDNPLLKISQADVADRRSMRELIAGAERVFHLAAMADIVPSVQQPEIYFDANVNGTLAVAEAVRANAARCLIYTASSSCYGCATALPTPESAPIAPRYPYALTKYLGEQLLLHWHQVYGLPVVSLRLFNVYGPRARTSGSYGAVFGVFLAQKRAGKPLTVVGDGTQRRDFTHVRDVVRALLSAAERAPAGAIYNVGSDCPVSVNDLVTLVGAERVAYIPKRPGEPECTFADTARIKRELGWTAEVPFEVGVREMLANLDDWSDAPVWTPDSIQEATRDWFRYLTP